MLGAGGQGAACPPVRVTAVKWKNSVPMAYTVGSRERLILKENVDVGMYPWT